MGDVIGDINSRRRIEGMDADSLQVQGPMYPWQKCSVMLLISLKTQGRGIHYAIVPLKYQEYNENL